MEEYAIRSAFRRLKFLSDEIDDRQTIFGGYEQDFMRVVKIARGNIKVQQDQEKLKKNLEDAADFNAKKKAEEALNEEDTSQPDLPQKKLYRKIAMETHPDRIDQMDLAENKKEELREIFKNAASAYEKDDVAEMIRLALKLDMDIADMGLPSDQVLTYVTKATKNLEKQINEMSESFVWMWGTSFGNLEMRVRLLEAYLRQTGHPPVSNTILRDIVRHHEDPAVPSDGSSRRTRRKTGERPKKLIR